MHRFFVSSTHIGSDVILDGEHARHLSRSLRATPGEQIVIVDAVGKEHGVVLDTVTPNAVTGHVLWSRPATGDPALAVHVIQAIPKEGMDGIVDMVSEIGAAHIWPVTTHRTVGRPHADQNERRLERWQIIARESAQLAGRGAIPTVHAVQALAAACAQIPSGITVYACATDATVHALTDCPIEPGSSVALCIGPEGGWDDRDRATLDELHATYVHLGPRVLRSRLAAAIALTVVLTAAGELQMPVATLPSDV